MKDKTYSISFDLYVDGKWIEDGLTAATLRRRIKEELPTELCSAAFGSEITVKKINVKINNSPTE
jgi:hypothetical protein